MNEIRLINANELEIELTKQKAHLMDKSKHTTIESDRMMYMNTATGLIHAINILHNAPTVEYPFYREAYQTGYEEGQNEKPTINCKDCDGYEAGYSAGLKDAERPTGEWIEIPVKRDLLYNTGIKYTCSICGRGNCYGKPPFCMYCGAEMKGGME